VQDSMKVSRTCPVLSLSSCTTVTQVLIVLENSEPTPPPPEKTSFSGPVLSINKKRTLVSERFFVHSSYLGLQTRNSIFLIFL
jgi:hypothetical protein